VKFNVVQIVVSAENVEVPIPCASDVDALHALTAAAIALEETADEDSVKLANAVGIITRRIVIEVLPL